MCIQVKTILPTCAARAPCRPPCRSTWATTTGRTRVSRWVADEHTTVPGGGSICAKRGGGFFWLYDYFLGHLFLVSPTGHVSIGIEVSVHAVHSITTVCYCGLATCPGFEFLHSLDQSFCKLVILAHDWCKIGNLCKGSIRLLIISKNRQLGTFNIRNSGSYTRRSHHTAIGDAE